MLLVGNILTNMEDICQGLVGLASILGALELDLESLGTNLVSVHCLDGRVGRLVCCEGDKTCGGRLVTITMASKRDSPKHLDRFVCLSTKTLADTMVPNGWNVWLRSESENSWDKVGLGR